MQNIYHSPWEAYPFLSEPVQDLRCDFELMTDELASLTGLLRSVLPAGEEEMRADLLWVCRLLYHFNPTLRTGFRITDKEVRRLSRLLRRLEENTAVTGFILPVGTTPACLAHLLRVKCKCLVRLLYAHMEKGHEAETGALDLANLLSGYFFFLALKLNAAEGTAEVAFTSRVY